MESKSVLRGSDGGEIIVEDEGSCRELNLPLGRKYDGKSPFLGYFSWIALKGFAAASAYFMLPVSRDSALNSRRLVPNSDSMTLPCCH